MKNESPQASPQLPSKVHTTKPLFGIGILFLIFLSGISGYLIGVKQEKTQKSQTVQPTPTPSVEITQRPALMTLSPLPTSVPNTTITFYPMPTVTVADWKTYTNTT